MNACPFHAIAYIPVPCEDSCPVGAISQNENGVRDINHEKCIHCGKCVTACPFGAVMEKSNLVEINMAMKAGRRVIAMVAPSVAGQFKAPLENILGSIRDLGFHDVMEVALGANITTQNEAEELAERLSKGDKLMTTSCCKAWTELVDKHLPEIEPFVSHTRSPLYYTAEIARQKYPDGVLVFVGPCLSKRKEAIDNPFVDFMLNFEELAAMLIAKGLNVALCSKSEIDEFVTRSSRGYAVTGGVTASVLKVYKGPEVNGMLIDGLNKASIKQLKLYATGNCPSNFIEIMSCEGGCVNGCGVLANPKVATRQVKQLSE
jgi:iron only hydrogenase large subunit-like protein